MAQNQNIDVMAHLSISEDGSSPDLTSLTPPPPGFDGSAATLGNGSSIAVCTGDGGRSGTPNTCKSTSFNNLAMALGTGLAESMDQGMDDSTSEKSRINNTAPQRTFTPDNYTRQSRHAVSRLMGSGGGGVVAGVAGGFDYLDPSGTGHLLIPPADRAYLDKLKAERKAEQRVQTMQHQEQQRQTRGYGGNQGGVNNASGLQCGNSPLFSSTQPNDQGLNNSGSQCSLAQAASAMDQNPVRFTASMMANAQSSGAEFQLMPNEDPSTVLSNSSSNQLKQKLLRQQLLQQSSRDNNGGNDQTDIGFNRAHSIGMTVVEPSSVRNTPEPQRHATMISMSGDGLLYPLMQQEGGGSDDGAPCLNAIPGTIANTGDADNATKGNDFMLGSAPVPMANFSSASLGPILTTSGGRASAPPSHSQPQAGHPFVPGGMTSVVMNNAAIRAYTASSLQMRVAELHQELGAKPVVGSSGGAVAGSGVAAVPVAALPRAAITLRSVPTATAIPVILTPAATPPPPGASLRPPSCAGGTPAPSGVIPVASRPPSRNGRALCEPPPPVAELSKHMLRSSTPGSALTEVTPNHQPAAMTVVVASGHPGGQPQPQAPMTMQLGGAGVTMTVAADPEQLRKDGIAAQELKPFLRDPPLTKDNVGNSPGASRGLAILHASSLPTPDVRSTCEAFGALESFRSDFGESKGVFFATYYDLRNAQLAVGELPQVLNKLGGGSSIGGRGNDGSGRIQVKYCVPLNSSSATDESMLMLTNLPGTVDEEDMNHVLSSFGEIRAVHYQASTSREVDEDEELTSYLVEFYDVQDARQALLELEQTNPWGARSKVGVGLRSQARRKQGRDLIVLMSAWRQGFVAATHNKQGENTTGQGPPQLQQQKHQHGDSVGNTASPTPSPPPPQLAIQPQQQQLQHQDTSSSHTARTSHVHHMNQHLTQHQQHQQHMDITQNHSMGSSSAQSYYPPQYNLNHNLPGLQQYQLVVGPDGQYSYAMVGQAPMPHHHPQMISHTYGHPGQMVIDPHTQQQHIVYAPAVDQQQYMMHNPHHNLVHNMNPTAQQYQIQYNGAPIPGANYAIPGVGQVLNSNQPQPPTAFIRLPSHDVNSSSLSSGSGPQSPSGNRVRAITRTSQKSSGSIGSGSSGNNSGGGVSGGQAVDQDDGNLLLNIDDVRSGRDHRSSLMVRNIPNKYTQRMLLAEFADAGHGSTKMDFFYLPIDFKNRCNRGYAFVNFVDYRDVIAFFDQYNDTGWKRFNSDKICDITYARIQGKAAMLKRFENSTLMEKDDEYRPKVFVSHGERKGEVEEIPGGGGCGTMGGNGSGGSVVAAIQ